MLHASTTSISFSSSTELNFVLIKNLKHWNSNAFFSMTTNNKITFLIVPYVSCTFFFVVKLQTKFCYKKASEFYLSLIIGLRISALFSTSTVHISAGIMSALPFFIIWKQLLFPILFLAFSYRHIISVDKIFKVKKPVTINKRPKFGRKYLRKNIFRHA